MSEYQQTNAAVIGRRGLRAVMGGRILNSCGDRRGRVGWAAMGAGDGM